MDHLTNRIYNSETSQTIWRGDAYRVLGKPATVDPPLYLLTEVERPAPEYDSETHRLVRLPARADLEAGEWIAVEWEIVSLTADDRRARIPPVVTPRQFRLALLATGISPSMISAAIADNEAALIEWEFASEIRRDHPLISALAAQMEKTEADIDAIFTAAATL